MKITALFSFLCAFMILTLAQGQSFEMFVSDAGNYNNPPWQILKFDEQGDNGKVFTKEGLGWPQDVVFLEDQSIVIVSNLNNDNITKYDLETGEYLGVFATGVSGPTRMKIGIDSLLYVLQWKGVGKVLRYNLDGSFLDAYTSTGLNSSIGMDWDKEGNLYVSSYSGHVVKKYDQNGVDQGNFIDSGLTGPTNIWFNEAGELLVANWDGVAVKRYDAEGTYIDDFITGLTNPEGIDIFPNGNMVIGNGGTNAVKLFDHEGQFISDIVPSGTLNLLVPNAVVLRDVSSVSTTEVEAIETNFVRPGNGRLFYLNDSAKIDIVRIEVYSQTGTLIHRKRLDGKVIWNADSAASGVYFIHGWTLADQWYMQKVMVAK